MTGEPARRNARKPIPFFALALILIASCSGASGPGSAAPTALVGPDVSGSPDTSGSPDGSEPAGETIATQGPAPLNCRPLGRDFTVDEGVGWEDVTEELGLIEPLTGMFGHAAAWGDVDGDLNPDLVVGTFTSRDAEAYQVRGADGPRDDALLMGGVAFSEAAGFAPSTLRTSGALFADLDGDGADELILINNGGPGGGTPGSSRVYENSGGVLDQELVLPLPSTFNGRTVTAADFDGDGLLDLVVAEDQYGDTGARLLRNVGQLQFEDRTAASGLPDQIFGLGVAAGDLTGDGHPDLFFSGAQALFVNRGDGIFREVEADTFEWPPHGDEDDVAGVVFADVNRDGRPDIVIGHHFNSVLVDGPPQPVRLFLHQGLDDSDDPSFREVTEMSGLIDLPTKAPHVEVADVNNDGWPDIITSASAAEGTLPAVFIAEGLVDGIPRFRPPTGLGSAQYWVTGATADWDGDGRLDLFLVEWEPALPSIMWRNTQAAGNWLAVEIAGAGRGVGSVISVFEGGRLGDEEALVGRQEINVSIGYGAGRQPQAHFGLGDLDTVDVSISPPGGEMIELAALAANQHLRWPSGC